MQAGELELFGAGKGRGQGAQTPTVPSSWLFTRGLAGLGAGSGSRAAVSIDIDDLREEVRRAQDPSLTSYHSFTSTVPGGGCHAGLQRQQVEYDMIPQLGLLRFEGANWPSPPLSPGT